MIEFQTKVGTWGDETFGKSSPDSVVNHLCREVLELAEAHDPAEAADCFLLLIHHAHKCGYDLLQEAKKKFEINKARKWGAPDEYGVVEHIRQPTSSIQPTTTAGAICTKCQEPITQCIHKYLR